MGSFENVEIFEDTKNYAKQMEKSGSPLNGQ